MAENFHRKLLFENMAIGFWLTSRRIGMQLQTIVKAYIARIVLSICGAFYTVGLKVQT